MEHPRFFTYAWWRSLSNWWVAMVVTSFLNGVLLIYAEPGHSLLTTGFVATLFGSWYFTLKAAVTHYERHRGESRNNSGKVILLILASITALGLAILLHAPQPLQALLCGATTTFVALLYKNYRVTEHIHHYGS